MSTNTEIFGAQYQNIVQVSAGSGNFPVDAGSFSDTGETPTPLGWTATSGDGFYNVGGRYASVTMVLATNPNYEPPEPPEDGGE